MKAWSVKVAMAACSDESFPAREVVRGRLNALAGCDAQGR